MLLQEDEDSSDDGSWVSEDDPDKLWCVCQKPHDNRYIQIQAPAWLQIHIQASMVETNTIVTRFMICCDTCLDWFHGKCVGITKQKGKEMEEVRLNLILLFLLLCSCFIFYFSCPGWHRLEMSQVC